MEPRAVTPEDISLAQSLEVRRQVEMPTDKIRIKSVLYWDIRLSTSPFIVLCCILLSPVVSACCINCNTK
jgi:hypothetical protein